MALWDKISSRGNVEDRRSMSPVMVGGLGLTGVVIYLVVNVLSGGQINLESVLGQLNELQPQQSQIEPNTNSDAFSGKDDYEVFASTVLGSNNDLWRTVFLKNNKVYTPPKLVLFRTATNSACGTSVSQMGPHYCSLDNTIYLDETFFEELTQTLGAKGGDVAEAYVIAHEVGHHVQNELGIMNQVDQESQNNPVQENKLSIKLELQADCFAGLWANSIKDKGIFLPGEINEAMDAAAAVGDDRVQKQVEGAVNPESWTHGSAEQRVSWFDKGYETGLLSACNTFKF